MKLRLLKKVIARVLFYRFCVSKKLAMAYRDFPVNTITQRKFQIDKFVYKELGMKYENLRNRTQSYRLFALLRQLIK